MTFSPRSESIFFRHSLPPSHADDISKLGNVRNPSALLCFFASANALKRSFQQILELYCFHQKFPPLISARYEFVPSAYDVNSLVSLPLSLPPSKCASTSERYYIVVAGSYTYVILRTSTRVCRRMLFGRSCVRDVRTVSAAEQSCHGRLISGRRFSFGQ